MMQQMFLGGLTEVVNQPSEEVKTVAVQQIVPRSDSVADVRSQHLDVELPAKTKTGKNVKFATDRDHHRSQSNGKAKAQNDL